MNKGFILKSPFDFDNAVYFQKPVEVWQHGQLIDYGGPIQEHTENAVVINGAKYLKAVCEFKVR